MRVSPSQFHPNSNELAAFGRGPLAGNVWRKVEVHAADCEACCESLASLPDDRLMQSLRAVHGSTEETCAFHSTDVTGVALPSLGLARSHTPCVCRLQ